MSKNGVVLETEARGGRYVYCIVNNTNELSLDNIGIDNASVYTVSYRDIAAVVHACQSQPYESKDEGKVKEWIFSHNEVIDKATEHFSTVLPFSFDSIIAGDDNTVRDWLSKSYEKLKQELERLKDKAEYTVRIFYDKNRLEEKIIGQDQALKELKEKIERMPERAAYLLQRKLELEVKDACNAMLVNLAEEFISKVKEHVEEMRVEERVPQFPGKYGEKKMILKVSCLVHRNKVEGLGEVLGEINDREGYDVRFTGPWAPFSFVDLGET